ncbi:protein of unknown function [Arenibacter nanhaiticus]|uniref:3-keto-alpha-glucoside-1,2-lyase/3-keto-2-hydroxy-glucal hydratase domain-containing protein n=1 Tax=Arenibacter nanhaiticus TaxID=558155 RepID=A0A1M6C303_9FLAO|nr:DUF1080 domain-containing protein [Arenibacter nanhaiticus]SHI55397.1 protein of unknown function [Arenibacter nanhaiticus]
MEINLEVSKTRKLVRRIKTWIDQFFTIKKNLLGKKCLVLILSIMGNLSCKAQPSTFTGSLFDSKTLKGWEVVNKENKKYWSVVDSVITGGDGITNIPTNTYLRTSDSYEDFEFRALFRLTGDHDTGLINSGIQYRSIIDGNKIIGYQADIGRGYWGDIYDEHRRAKLIGGDLSTLRYLLKEDGWNSYIIRCKGNKHELYINGVKTTEYMEKDPGIPSKGVIGIQLHSGGNAKIEFRNITITRL